MQKKYYFTITILLISNVLFCQTWQGSEEGIIYRLKKSSEGKYELKIQMKDGRVLKGSFNRLGIIKDDKYDIIKNTSELFLEDTKIKLQEMCQYDLGEKKGKCVLLWLETQQSSDLFWYEYNEWSESYGEWFLGNKICPNILFRKIK